MPLSSAGKYGILLGTKQTPSRRRLRTSVSVVVVVVVVPDGEGEGPFAGRRLESFTSPSRRVVSHSLNDGPRGGQGRFEFHEDGDWGGGKRLSSRAMAGGDGELRTEKEDDDADEEEEEDENNNCEARLEVLAVSVFRPAPPVLIVAVVVEGKGAAGRDGAGESGRISDGAMVGMVSGGGDDERYGSLASCEASCGEGGRRGGVGVLPADSVSMRSFSDVVWPSR